MVSERIQVIKEFHDDEAQTWGVETEEDQDEEETWNEKWRNGVWKENERDEMIFQVYIYRVLGYVCYKHCRVKSC